MKKIEILSKEHVKQVVDTQYQLLVSNELTKSIFAHLELQEHLPRIYNFWCFILQINPEENRYTGSVFTPHIALNLKAEHFDFWLQCLQKGLEPFSGTKAEDWWVKANQQALLFKYKLGIDENLP